MKKFVHKKAFTGRKCANEKASAARKICRCMKMLEARHSISLMISLSYSGCSLKPKALRLNFIDLHRSIIIKLFLEKSRFSLTPTSTYLLRFFPLVSLHKAAKKHLLVAYLLPRLPRQPFNFPSLERRLERQSSAQFNWKIE